MKPVVCLILGLSCVLSVPKQAVQSSRIDSEMQAYFDEFRDDAAKHGFSLDASQYEMSFRMTQDDTDFLTRYPRTVAFCVQAEKRIAVRQDYWAKLDYWGKRLVLRHEFGHCFLSLEHTHDLDAKHSDLNIMDGGLMDAAEYKAKASQYDTDMFKSAKYRGIAASHNENAK